MTAHDEAPRGAGIMNRVRLGLLIAVGLVAIVSVVSFLLSRGDGDSQIAQTTTLYHCPMHPTYTSDREGECPICGMDYVLVDQPGSLAEGHGLGNVPGLTTVHIEPERLQLIGVRTAAVERAPLSAGLSLVGFVAPDEARLRRVQLRTTGWIQTLHVNRTGDVVERGQPLLDIYSPQLYQSEQEFLIELEAHDGAHGMAGSAAPRERLRLLGVPDDEIERLERERTAASTLTLNSPVTGTVLERNVVEGQHVGAETALFTIADLSRVWVLADLYEIDFTKVKAGDRALFEADALPGTKIDGRVDFIYPTVSNDTRTLKVRIVLDNRGGRLRPGMYGRVRVSSATTEALSVPLEAVVSTGDNHYVFVVGEPGHFEPRRVQIGMRDDDRAQILGGLSDGETVVASATFLIDSESRLRAAIQGMQADDAATGHDHGSAP